MMKHRVILVVLGLTASGPWCGSRVARGEDAGTRAVRAVTDGWRFQVDARDIGEREHWYGLAVDRSAWRQVPVPGAWDVLDESMRGYEGIGWYAVALDGTWARAGKIQHLTFGRVMYHARVWLNGELLGEHIDGYLPFTFDITGKLKDAANLLVIRVDNRPRIDWLPAAQEIEWVQYGGILQPVRVETMEPVFISDLEIRAVPTAGGASISCTAEITAREDAVELTLRLAVRGDERSPVTVSITPRAGMTSRHSATLELERASPWSPDSPAIYTLDGVIERRGVVIDRLSSSFGVRSIAVRGRQLLLNGKPIQIKGVNRYDELGRFGPNPPGQLVEDDLRLIKKTGINLIRTHYPQAPEFLDLCDRVGILFLEELPINWWGVDWFGKEGLVQDESLLDRALPMLETMIRRDKNHPCLIIWSMANESKTDNAVGIKVMRALIGRTKARDPSRLVTFVTAPGSVGEHRAYEDADLVATNIYYGSLEAPYPDHLWQLDQLARKASEEHLRRQLKAFPDKPILITEFGAIGHRGMHGDVPSTEEFQAAYITAVWRAISNVPEVSGGVVWSWADYYHRRHFQNNGAFGAFGVVTVDRKPKAALEALFRAFGGQ